MANVKRIKNTPPPPAPLPDTISIELSLKEAGGLRNLIGNGIKSDVAHDLSLYDLWDALNKIELPRKPFNYFQTIASKRY